jgi:hypothetical protein
MTDWIDRAAVERKVRWWLEHLTALPERDVTAIIAAIRSLPAQAGEGECPDCQRHVLMVNEPASGWLAACGRRLSRLKECGHERRCNTDAHGEPVLPTHPTPKEPETR